jgi:Ethanolamine utilization protein EutJ (predicted chaperonin)
VIANVVELGLIDVEHVADPTGASLVYMSTDAADIDLGSLRDQLKLLADYL